MDLILLHKIGFSNGEVKVYQELLKLGSSSLNNLHQQSGIERHNLQDILNKLIKKGLVSFNIEKNKRTYQTSHPNVLFNFVVDRENQLKEIKKELDNQMPSLIESYKNHRPAMNATLFRGKDGLISVAEDMLNYQEVFFIGGGGDIEKKLPYFTIHYNNRRIKKKVMWHDLIQEGTLMEIFKKKTKKELKDLQFYEYKTLPLIFKSPHHIAIYGDKVANILWDEDFFATVIQNASIAKNYKNYFHHLWKSII